MESDSNQLVKDINLKDFASVTLIATPKGEKQIQDFEPGDSVLAFSAKPESDKIQLTASDSKVVFSSGANDFGMAIFIGVTDGRQIICSVDQPLLLINGKYIRSRDLRPGQMLVDKDGNPAQVVMVSVGEYRGKIYAIGVGTQSFTGPDNHLILAEGLIVGDFIFQLYFDILPNNLKEESL